PPFPSLAPVAPRHVAPVPAPHAAPAPAPAVVELPDNNTAPLSPPAAAATALARGTGTPADAALADGDAAFDRADLKHALAAYQRAARLAPSDPAPVAGIARATLAAPDVSLVLGSAPKNRRLLALLTELDRARTFVPDYEPVERERGKVLLVLGR